MPRKHPNTERWGGPGASHEDATKPMPPQGLDHPEGEVSTSPRVSQVSGGGGERDEKHSHQDKLRSAKSHATDSPSPTSTRAWRQNRSRRDRARDLEEAQPDESGAADGPADGGDADEGAFLIQINTADWKGVSASLERQVEAQVHSALRPFADRITRVEVYIAEEASGPTNPQVLSCSIEARLAGRRPLTAGASGPLDAAIQAAAKKLRRNMQARLSRDAKAKKGADTIRREAPGYG